MQGYDVIGVAATGSGKSLGHCVDLRLEPRTLAFLLPAFHYLLERQVRAGLGGSCKLVWTSYGYIYAYMHA